MVPKIFAPLKFKYRYKDNLLSVHLCSFLITLLEAQNREVMQNTLNNSSSSALEGTSGNLNSSSDVIFNQLY